MSDEVKVIKFVYTESEIKVLSRKNSILIARKLKGGSDGDSEMYNTNSGELKGWGTGSREMYSGEFKEWGQGVGRCIAAS